MAYIRCRYATKTRTSSTVCLFVALLALFAVPARADNTLVDQLRKLDATVLPADDESKQKHRRTLHELQRDRIQYANKTTREAWHKIATRDEWESYAHKRIAAMRQSIATFPMPPEDPKETPYRVTNTIPGDGFKIHNIVYQSRPGLLVTANLYAPDPARDSSPGIVIVHSHHRPKTHGELQDMGMTWARAGCYVLVPDQLGHGERRQHPFASADDYPEDYRVSRQDYYFRYNTAMQLYLIGDSLIGWMAWDNMRGFDVLLQQPGIDDDRLIILGAVAGGGDPAAVTAALDERIDCLVPFNFGGPQPETHYPLPDDAETSFNYAGGGSWESTRNIAFSVEGEFLPWIIVASIAPRKLIHAHEFSWDRQRDPVWKRYEKVWGEFYDARDNLAFAHGYGLLRQSGDEASHCTHIGAPHRKLIHEAFEKWFGIEAKEYRGRMDEGELLCMTDQVREEMGGKPMREVARRIRRQRRARLDDTLRDFSPQLRLAPWVLILDERDTGRGWVEQTRAQKLPGGVRVERVKWTWTNKNDVEMVTPAILLHSRGETDGRRPAVIMFAQHGKQHLLRERAEAIAQLLGHGVVVCLPDLRGTGELAPNGYRGRRSWDTSVAASALMAGDPILAQRLRDLLGVLRQMRDMPGIGRIALWGDSLAPANPRDTPDAELRKPLELDQPAQAEPMGATLALLGSMYGLVSVTYARGGLISFESLLDEPFVHVPLDVIVPGALRVGDLPEVTAKLSPHPVRLDGLVDGLNRPATNEAVARAYRVARKAHEWRNSWTRLFIHRDPTDQIEAADWVVNQFKR